MPIIIDGSGTITGASTLATVPNLPDDTITTSDITNDNVTTAKIADSNITAAKLSGNSAYASGTVVGTAPAFAARAWFKYNSDVRADVSGTYVQSGTPTLTVTLNSHGHVAGHQIYLNFTTGTAPDQLATVTSSTDNTFTITSTSTLTTSGAVTLNRVTYIAGGNISPAIPYVAAGQCLINFANPMPHANYIVCGGGGIDGDRTIGLGTSGTFLTTASSTLITIRSTDGSRVNEPHNYGAIIC
jgi:hypothetical protein